MSNWTQIAGIIRIDAIHYDKDHIAKAVGATHLYPESRNHGDGTHHSLPSGSEGSLNFKVIPNRPNTYNIAQIAIWGSLRDFAAKDFSKLTAYFEKFLSLLNPMTIRQFNVVAESDCGHCVMYTSKDVGEEDEYRDVLMEFDLNTL